MVPRGLLLLFLLPDVCLKPVSTVRTTTVVSPESMSVIVVDEQVTENQSELTGSTILNMEYLPAIVLVVFTVLALIICIKVILITFREANSLFRKKIPMVLASSGYWRSTPSLSQKQRLIGGNI
ncbi:hypothetical protein AAFF_G00254680 [Aldrovandia affinis]|uniref:Uncharacterized protein n=1 Tax=Aldrovandia affinis TaxID=143900 RepID=A0AAD7RCJ5_9TELE|nr:hypothetical protein AAFF_G00254680 [Aldrovandia affinis]